MDDELEFVCEKCVHYEVCDRSSRMIWARLGKEKTCTDFMEVVRCKDCKNCRTASWGEKFCARKQSDGVYVELSNLREDDFCSYGERKEQ